jgi:hypothetical protein
VSTSPEPNPLVHSEAVPRRRDVRISLLLGLACLLIYNANLRSIGSGDTLPARYLPFGIWRHGTVVLDPIRDATIEGHAQPYWIVRGPAGHSLSLYPIVLPVLIAPLYLPAVTYLHFRGWTEWRLRRVATVMEKLVSSLLAAAATALLFLVLRRRAPTGDAVLLALVFAFGTNTWMIGSQALWQHGIAELLLVGALLALTGPCTTPRALAAGALCGLIAGARPPDVLLAAALGLYGLFWSGRRAAWVAVGAAIPLGLVLAYNVVVAGNVLGGYGIPKHGGFFRHGLLTGVAGLLLSPTRGLLVFSPFLLLVPAAVARGLREGNARALTLLAGVGVLAQVLFYAKGDWRAGHSWGPRWLTDMLPLLVWMLPPGLASLRGIGRRVFVLACGASMAVQAVGAFCYTSESDVRIFSSPPGPDELRGAWNPRNTPFLLELRHGLAGADPAFTPWRRLEAQGSIERVTARGNPVEVVTSGTLLTLEGWALAGGRYPAAVELTLDGHFRGVTSAFFSRPEIGAAAGWRIDVETDGVAPGTHVLAVAAHLNGSAIALPVAQREITIVTRHAKLDSAAQDVAALLGAHQQPAGFWLTSHTLVPRFESAHQEMNTFLTAMMIDLLAPVASDAGVGENVARARNHLDGQIESDGLVRYHGRPDAPTIHSLGCAITPDADDTALAWRLAVHDHPGLLPRALAVLAQYRTGEGLYRTWLAPRERYECIDPGKDPNPTDVGIQMHMYLFLAQSEPPAARALCDALGKAVGEDRLWVYYQVAPLVPLLRQADLRRAGCSVSLPEAHLHTSVAGQEVWLDAARLLNRLLSTERPAPTSSETLALLDRLAKDGFSTVRMTPPLLYHNDVTGSTPRFYWSEDFGYALWLRLYVENLRRNGDAIAHP